MKQLFDYSPRTTKQTVFPFMTSNRDPIPVARFSYRSGITGRMENEIAECPQLQVDQVARFSEDPCFVVGVATNRWKHAQLIRKNRARKRGTLQA